MKRENLTYTFVILLTSTILMIINGIVIIQDNAPKVVSSFQKENFTGIWNSQMFWGRIVFGIPSLVEGGLAYFWLLLVAVLLIITIRVGMRPKMQKRYGLWIVVLSLLSIPIGGGFYLGAIIGAIVGLYAREFPKPFKETFVGKIVSVLMGNSKILESLSKNPKNLQMSAMTVILVAVVGGFGSCLYVFNLSHIYPAGSFNATAASRILLQGSLYVGVPFYTSVIASISIGILKWLILSALVYLLGVKLLGSDAGFGTTSSVLAFVFVPEILFIFMPVMFPIEPYLSQAWQFMLIPVSWPLILYYITHLWSLFILVLAVEKMLDVTRGKAFGTALLVAIPYFITNYLILNPILGTPGFRIEFTSISSQMILFLSSIALSVAAFLGAFKKE